MSVYNQVVRDFASMDQGGREYLLCDRDGRRPKVIYPDHESAEQCADALHWIGNERQCAYQCEVDPTHHHLTRHVAQVECACQRVA